jgi:hypothetical protein
MNQEEIVSASIEVIGEGKKMVIICNFFVAARTESDGGYSCSIPAFGIHFSAKDDCAIEKKSRALTQIYINHFISLGEAGLNAFIREIKRRGFVQVCKEENQCLSGVDSRYKSNFTPKFPFEKLMPSSARHTFA